MINCVVVLSAIMIAGGSGTLEHPADPGRAPFPSIFVTDLIKNWVKDFLLQSVSFAQCMFGCPAKKETTVVGRADQMEENLGRQCSHVRHPAQLCGVDETGKFRTRIAQAYPSGMCRALAETHFNFMMNRRPGQNSRLSDTTLKEVIAQLTESRVQQGTKELPTSFAKALG